MFATAMCCLLKSIQYIDLNTTTGQIEISSFVIYNSQNTQHTQNNQRIIIYSFHS